MDNTYTFRNGVSRGDQFPCSLIADIGLTHSGSFEEALSLIEIAAECGADAVKLNILIQTLLATKSYLTYTTRGGNTITSNMYDMLKSLEFTFDEWKLIKDFAEKNHLLLSALLIQKMHFWLSMN